MRCKHRYNVRLDKGIATCFECEKEITIDTWCDINNLEKENAVLREALERIADNNIGNHYWGDHGMGSWEECNSCVDAREIAQQALQRAGGGE